MLPPPLDTLSASELADQVEQIRLSPRPLNPEEMSRLWSAIQSNYRPTAVYQASVVLIESRRPTRQALPVSNDKRRIYVVPFRHPVIEKVVSADGDRAPLVAGATLEIHGRDLQDDVTLVNLHGVELVPSAEQVTPSRLTIPLTSPLPAGLHAGVKGIQVVHRMRMGDPETDHRGVESNAAAFVLRPTVTNGPVMPPADVLDLTASTESSGGTTVQLRAGRLRVRLDPRVGREQRVLLLLNEFDAAPGAAPHAYTFRAPSGNSVPEGLPDSDSVDIPFRRVVAGTYLVRVQVDGAESPLGQSGDGTLASPRVVLA